MMHGGTSPMKRKIAAILAADVAGYSRLVAEAEEETLTRLGGYREVFDDSVRRAGGRIFNTAGDSVMCEFDSAVDAVRCAIDIQESLRTRNRALPPGRRLEFRIGITPKRQAQRSLDSEARLLSATPARYSCRYASCEWNLVGPGRHGARSAGWRMPEH